MSQINSGLQVISTSLPRPVPTGASNLKEASGAYRVIVMRLTIAVSYLLLAACVACGKGGSSGHSGGIGQSSDTYLYVSSAQNKTIAGFQINSDTGSISAVAGAPFRFNGTVPGRMATDSQGRLLFVADRSASSLSVYLIDPVTGILTAVGAAATPTPPQDVATAPTANLIYVLSPTQISAFRFDSTLGTLTTVPGSPFPVGTGAGVAAGQRLVLDSVGRFLYVTNLIEILTYEVSSDGSLALVSRWSQPGASLTGIASHPLAAFVYAVSPASGAGQAGGVFGFSTDSTGRLTPLPGSPFPAGLEMRELTMDKGGKFVAVGGGPPSEGIISFFTVDPATGRLIQVSQSPFASPPDPVQLTIDPLGRFVYSANADLSNSTISGSGNVSAFAIDTPTKNLTPINGSPFTVAAPAGLISVRPKQ